MFRPGEIARMRVGASVRNSDGDFKIIRYTDDTFRSVETDRGVFLESQLYPAHPSVLLTISGQDSEMAEFLRREQEEDDIEVEPKDVDSTEYPSLGDDEKERIIKQILVTLPTDLKGHDIVPDGSLRDYFMSWAFSLDNKEFFLLKQALEDGPAMTELVHIGLTSMPCAKCNSTPYKYIKTDGKHVVVDGDPCSYQDNMEPVQWELNVPSGRLVVASDLTDLFPLHIGAGRIESHESEIGRQQLTQQFALHGVAHAYVGKSKAGIYCVDEEKLEYVVASGKGEKQCKVRLNPFHSWYSMCDLDEYKLRKEFFAGPELELNKPKSFKVKPGVYLFTHRSIKHKGEFTVHSEFKWIRPPEPDQGLLAACQNHEIKPYPYVRAQVVEWPSLYGGVTHRDTPVPWENMTTKAQHNAWRCVADHIFFTIGNGVNWNPKGFPYGCSDPSLPDMEPPLFRAQYGWYPFSKNYSGWVSKNKLTPAFAKLLLNCLESIISFGMHVNESAVCREVHSVRERMGHAVERARELVKEYPTIADPQFMGWLQTKQPEAWVKNFDLGPVCTPAMLDLINFKPWLDASSYAIKVDATKLSQNRSLSARGYWSNEANATGIALPHAERKQHPKYYPKEFNKVASWTTNAVKSVPLTFIARVVGAGCNFDGEPMVEIAFDYDKNSWMQSGLRVALSLNNNAEAAITVLSKGEYEEELPNFSSQFKQWSAT